MLSLFIPLQSLPEVPLTDMEVLSKITLKLFFRLLIDFSAMLVLVRLVYFKMYQRKELFFTFFIFNLVIFLICFLLNKVDLSMGAAFGLFAVFSMLRYRTEDIGIKDMSYLFVVIAIGLINAVAKIKGASDYYEYIFLVLINTIVIVMAYLFESSAIFKNESVQIINYDKIELIHTSNSALVLEDLRARTGLNVHRFSVVKIDFTKGTAQLKVYYSEN